MVVLTDRGEAKMSWKNKIIAALVAVGLMTCSSLSYAFGEMEHVNLDVYVYPSGAPLGYIESDVTKPQGFDIDIVYELQRRLFFTLEENRIFPLQFDAAFQRLEEGSADLVVGGISFTQARAEKYDFTPIYFRSCLAVVYSKRHHPEIKSAQDLKGLKVGFQRGTTAADFIDATGGQGVPFDNTILALFQVSDGKLDALIYDRPPMAEFVRTMPNLDLAVTNDVFGEAACEFAFVMPKNYKYTRIINQTMQSMMDDGTIDALLKKWHLEKLDDLRASQAQD